LGVEETSNVVSEGRVSGGAGTANITLRFGVPLSAFEEILLSRECWLVKGPAGEVNRRLGLTVAGEVDRVSLKGLSGGRRSAGDSRVTCSEGFPSSNGSISAAFDVQGRAKVLFLSCSKENMTLKRTVFVVSGTPPAVFIGSALAMRASRRRLALWGT
jgi:hypothetical protein